jgi:hypothetical protein
MKYLLLLLSLLPFSASASSMLEVDLSKRISPFVEIALIEAFGEETYELLMEKTKTHKVSVRVPVGATLTATNPQRDCEVVIEKKSSGGGSVSVDGPVVSASGGGGGRGSRKITIKGPCKEVAKLLKMAMDDGS